MVAGEVVSLLAGCECVLLIVLYSESCNSKIIIYLLLGPY